MTGSNDPLKGYRNPARATLERFGVRVWSDVRCTNDAGSVSTTSAFTSTASYRSRN